MQLSHSQIMEHKIMVQFLSLFIVNIYGHREHGHTRSLAICAGGMTCDS